MDIAYSNEKRLITRSPVTDPDGNLFLFQPLWKGTTDLCRLKMSPAVALHISSLIVHDHTTHRLHRPPSPNAQATVGQEILLNFEAGLCRTGAWELCGKFGANSKHETSRGEEFLP